MWPTAIFFILHLHHRQRAIFVFISSHLLVSSSFISLSLPLSTLLSIHFVFIYSNEMNDSLAEDRIALPTPFKPTVFWPDSQSYIEVLGQKSQTASDKTRLVCFECCLDFWAAISPPSPFPSFLFSWLFLFWHVFIRTRNQS